MIAWIWTFRILNRSFKELSKVTEFPQEIRISWNPSESFNAKRTIFLSLFKIVVFINGEVDRSPKLET